MYHTDKKKFWKPAYKSLNNASTQQYDASNVFQKPTKNGWEYRAIKNALDDLNHPDNGDDPRVLAQEKSRTVRPR